MIKNKKKVICIIGATASGKSSLAEKIAKKENGSIISADSRQVYKNLEIFSGISENEKKNYLIGFLDQWEDYSASIFVNYAEKKMEEIWEEGKVPIIVGGTSFYFKSLLYQNFIPKVEKNIPLRKKLELKSAEELISILSVLDKRRSKNIDNKNKPRIIRSIEIATKLGKVPNKKDEIKKDIEIIVIWINNNKDLQKERIEKNFKDRIKKGLIKEAFNLKKKLQKKRFSEEKIKEIFFKIGLSYKHIFKFWNGDISKEQFVKLGIIEEQKYSKRQKTYLKKFFKEVPKEVDKKEIT